jgi:hypothetical protein
MRTSERKNYSVTSLDTDNIVVVMNGRTAAIVSQTLADAPRSNFKDIYDRNLAQALSHDLKDEI